MKAINYITPPKIFDIGQIGDPLACPDVKIVRSTGCGPLLLHPELLLAGGHSIQMETRNLQLKPLIHLTTSTTLITALADFVLLSVASL